MTPRTFATVYTKDVANKKMKVEREFAAPVDRVWAAWTKNEILDKWWAPKPWKAETKSQNFKEGGTWLYCMVGPAGEKHWARLDYLSITPQKGYRAVDSFCDENGNKADSFPSMNWNNTFTTSPNGTKVSIEILFANDGDMEKIIEMGFKEGFEMAHGNLDELLAGK